MGEGRNGRLVEQTQSPGARSMPVEQPRRGEGLDPAGETARPHTPSRWPKKPPPDHGV
jgi:hypothetical protein